MVNVSGSESKIVSKSKGSLPYYGRYELFNFQTRISFVIFVRTPRYSRNLTFTTTNVYREISRNHLSHVLIKTHNAVLFGSLHTAAQEWP